MNGKRPLVRPDLVVVTARAQVVDRFWSFVDRRGPDECWEWTGARNNGYGSFGIANCSHFAHRVSFVIAFGWAPPAVLHKCDNPPCVNPRHLFGGTAKDNVADCIAKGRFPNQIHPHVRSTILALHEAGMSHRAVARQVGVSHDSVDRIVRTAS